MNLITQKQIDFIELLFKNINYDTTIFKWISNALEKDIKNYNELTAKEISIVIGKLKNRQKLTVGQKTALLKEYGSIDTIPKMLNIELKSVNDLMYYHYKILKKKKFKMKYNDHPIETCFEYEYGWQESELCEDGKMYYIKFYDLMMLDYDYITYEDLIEILNPFLDRFLFRIYKTYNGFHVFIISEPINHINCKNIMKILKCDNWYMLFSEQFGYKIRLNRKINRDEIFVAKYIETIGNKSPDENLIKLIEKHDNFLNSKLK